MSAYFWNDGFPDGARVVVVVASAGWLDVGMTGTVEDSGQPGLVWVRFDLSADETSARIRQIIVPQRMLALLPGDRL